MDEEIPQPEFQVIIPDVNLLLYAYDSASPFHSPAAAGWMATLRGTEPVGLADVATFGFICIATHPRIYSHPMEAGEAVGHVRSWLQQPPVQVLATGPEHVRKALEFIEPLGTAGNLASDAQLAALALEHEGILHTADADFIRFRGLRWFNPISGIGSAGLRRTRH